MNDHLIFNENDHTATVDGRLVPRVTTVLAASGYGPPPIDAATLEWYGERGKFVHEALALDDQGKLDEAALDPQLRPYLEAWRRYRRECNVVGFVLIEAKLHHRNPDFAGRVDRVTYDGRLLEITTSRLGDRGKILQAVAYWGALRQYRPAVIIRSVEIVSLRPDGYRLASAPGASLLLLWNEFKDLVRAYVKAHTVEIEVAEEMHNASN